MTAVSNFFASTIGRKQLVGLTGLGLSLFVLSHMLGNMLIFVSPQLYNEYSHALISNPLIYVAEAGLVLFFGAHLIIALKLTLQNWQARSESYGVSAKGDKATSAVTKTLWAQGLLIFVFVIYHLITFKYGTYYGVNYGQGEIRDLYRLVVEVFQHPGYVIWYFICLLALGFHLSHGLSSSLQTLGLHHPKYHPMIKKMSWVYAIVVAGGFIVQPIYVFLFYKG